MSEGKRRVVTPDLWGWKQIADVLQVSRQTARRWSRRAKLPLPVSSLGGRIVARTEDLRAWVDRETGRSGT